MLTRAADPAVRVLRLRLHACAGRPASPAKPRSAEPGWAGGPAAFVIASLFAFDGLKPWARSFITSWIRVGELTAAGTRVVVPVDDGERLVGGHRRRGVGLRASGPPQGRPSPSARRDRAMTAGEPWRCTASRTRDDATPAGLLRCHRSSSALPTRSAPPAASGSLTVRATPRHELTASAPAISARTATVKPLVPIRIGIQIPGVTRRLGDARRPQRADQRAVGRAERHLRHHVHDVGRRCRPADRPAPRSGPPR